MTDLSHTIRAIRQRLGKTMVEFAEMVGCRQSTISRYESGKLLPGRSVLLLILQLAQGAERGPVLDALGVSPTAASGWAERDLIGALKTFEEYLEVSSRSAGRRARPRAPTASLAAFARAAKRIVLEGANIEPALASILERWLQHGADAKAQQYFQNAAAYLDVQLAVLAGPRRRRAQRSSSSRRSRTQSAPSIRVVPEARR